MFKNYLFTVIYSLLILLFVYAAISKWLDFYQFKEQLGKAPYIGPAGVFIAFLVPLAELVIALLLIIERTRYIGLVASLIMLYVFTFYILIILSLNNKLPCSCGGVLEGLTWKQHIGFNISFIILTCTGLWLNKNYTLKKLNK